MADAAPTLTTKPGPSGWACSHLPLTAARLPGSHQTIKPATAFGLWMDQGRSPRTPYVHFSPLVQTLPKPHSYSQ